MFRLLVRNPKKMNQSNLWNGAFGSTINRPYGHSAKTSNKNMYRAAQADVKRMQYLASQAQNKQEMLDRLALAIKAREHMRVHFKVLDSAHLYWIQKLEKLHKELKNDNETVSNAQKILGGQASGYYPNGTDYNGDVGPTIKA